MKNRTPEEIESLYKKIRQKKKNEGVTYTKMDFLNDIGIVRQATYSEWTSGAATPGRQSEMLMDVLEKRELG